MPEINCAEPGFGLRNVMTLIPIGVIVSIQVGKKTNGRKRPDSRSAAPR
ncbi:hypothetical protein [Nocardia sp. NPDC004123]